MAGNQRYPIAIKSVSEIAKRSRDPHGSFSWIAALVIAYYARNVLSEGELVTLLSEERGLRLGRESAAWMLAS